MAMTLLLEAMLTSEEAQARTLALRILRELSKTEHKRVGEYAEIVTLRVLANFADGDATVSVLLGREGRGERGRGRRERERDSVFVKHIFNI